KRNENSNQKPNKKRNPRSQKRMNKKTPNINTINVTIGNKTEKMSEQLKSSLNVVKCALKAGPSLALQSNSQRKPSRN
ncbi:hypothetical protein, partial [Salmonella sp. s54925]|uniref:hypothetical protein n=1 Tax=Salmonella sp. s54925 TaxID=3159674 RepID=UPI00397F2445